jgi:hypothetical protein
MTVFVLLTSAVFTAAAIQHVIDAVTKPTVRGRSAALVAVSVAGGLATWGWTLLWSMR